MFVEINPADAGSAGSRMGMGLGDRRGEQLTGAMKALVTERVGKGVPGCLINFAAGTRAPTCAPNIPKGADPFVLGESREHDQTYGYDPATGMQEPKATLCQIRRREKAKTMARMKVPLRRRPMHIDCNACVTACKNENEVPWGINRRRVRHINDGKAGERSVSMAACIATDAPCAAVCPVTCIYPTDDGIVLHNKDLCIAAATAFMLVHLERRSIRRSAISAHGARWDKCTYCGRWRGAEAPAVPRNLRNTAPTGSAKASSRYAPNVLHQVFAGRVMATSLPRFTRHGF